MSDSFLFPLNNLYNAFRGLQNPTTAHQSIPDYEKKKTTLCTKYSTHAPKRVPVPIFKQAITYPKIECKIASTVLNQLIDIHKRKDKNEHQVGVHNKYVPCKHICTQHLIIWVLQPLIYTSKLKMTCGFPFVWQSIQKPTNN